MHSTKLLIKLFKLVNKSSKVARGLVGITFTESAMDRRGITCNE